MVPGAVHPWRQAAAEQHSRQGIAAIEPTCLKSIYDMNLFDSWCSAALANACCENMTRREGLVHANEDGCACASFSDSRGTWAEKKDATKMCRRD